jgi:hypothetical protein
MAKIQLRINIVFFCATAAFAPISAQHSGFFSANPHQAIESRKLWW